MAAQGIEDQGADAALVAALLAGDEAAFGALVERLHPRIVRFCRRFVVSDAAAEDVAQDTWQAVLQALPGFEGRCAFDTWVLQIAVNHARTRGARDARARPTDDLDDGLAGRFSWLGIWKEPPRASLIDGTPESDVGNRELMQVIAGALDELPEQQRLVVLLRDVEHRTAAEVCALLGLSEENQRVLLHRGRSRLRAALELATGEPAPIVAVSA